VIGHVCSVANSWIPHVWDIISQDVLGSSIPHLDIDHSIPLGGLRPSLQELWWVWFSVVVSTLVTLFN
jgi:hypothetical protein